MIPEIQSYECSTMRSFRVKLDPKFANGHDFVELIVDEHNNSFTSRLYGNEVYTQSWGAPGDSFIEFLVKVFENGDDYLFHKIADHTKSDLVDMSKTIDSMKAKVRKARRNNELTEEDARENYEQIEEWYPHDDMSLEHFHGHCRQLVAIFDDEPWEEESVVRSEDHKARIFVSLVAPTLAKLLRKEYPQVFKEKVHAQ